MSANTFVTSGAYLVGDPEERLAGDTPLVEFTVVDNAWNEKRYKAKFITCSFSGKMAEQARLMRAKEPVTVGGRLDYRTYPGRDGNERVAFEIQRPTLFVPGVDTRGRGPAPEADNGETAEPAETTPAPGTAKKGSRFD